LRHTNDTLQALVKASPRAIIMLDREEKVKIWNPAAEQMFGWTEAEVLNSPNPIGLEDYPTLLPQHLARHNLFPFRISATEKRWHSH
jgi:PAS domain S-box-containing protein